MANYSVYEVANWFLSKEEMSPKKLQKLVYYAYAWTLVFQNEKPDKLENRLFDECIEAWVHGPVVKGLYHKYADYGYKEIDKVYEKTVQFSVDIEDTLNEVWDTYGKFNGNQLESLTHSESPWQKAREGLRPLDSSDNKLDDRVIFDYYTRQLVS